MKKSRERIHPIALILITTITPFALAQVATPPAGPNAANPVNAAGATATQSQVGTINAHSATAASAAPTAIPNVSTTTPGAINPSVNTPSASAGASGSVTGSTAVGSTGTAINATGHANPGVIDPTPATPGVTVPSASAGSMAVDSQVTSQQLRSLGYDARADAAHSVESQLDASSQVMINARSRAGDLRGEEQARLQSALGAVRERESRLRSSLSAVKSAGRANYEAARNRLAQDYEAYTSAVAQVEASSRMNVPR